MDQFDRLALNSIEKFGGRIEVGGLSIDVYDHPILKIDDAGGDWRTNPDPANRYVLVEFQGAGEHKFYDEDAEFMLAFHAHFYRHKSADRSGVRGAGIPAADRQSGRFGGRSHKSR